MSTFQKLRDKAKAGISPEPPEVRGMWFNIRVVPDLATGETLNIGVGFVGQDSQLQCQWLDRFEAFDCLYRNRLSAENVRLLVQIVRASMPKELPGGQLPLLPSPHVVFSPLKFTSGESAEAILEDLFHETVTMAHVAPAKEEVEEKPDSMNTATVRKRVFDALFQLDPMAMRIVAETPEWPVPLTTEDGRPRILDMPLRGPHRFGNVVSAWHRSKPSLELNMLRAEVDLDLAMRLYPQDLGGLFIMRPPSPQWGFREEHHRQIDNIIDDLNWRMQIHHLRFEVEDSDLRLAEHILEWAA